MSDAKSIQSKRMSFAAGISIVAGALIIFSSLIGWFGFTTSSIFGSRGMWGWMDNFIQEWWSGLGEETRGVEGTMTGVPLIAVVTGLASGFVVLLAGAMMYLRPESRRIWGIMALIFSVLAFLSLGGFLFGTGLGIIGGILAIANRQVR